MLPACPGPWKTPLYFQWPAHQRAGSKAAPYTELESPTVLHRRPIHHWPLWTCPEKKKKKMISTASLICAVTKRIFSITHQQDAFPRHPANRQHSPPLDPVVVTSVQVSTHAKIGDLYRVLLSDQTIASGQVTVDEVEGGQILHSGCNLHCHPDQFIVAKSKTISQII